MSASAPLEIPGKTLGGYEIVGRLGAGGMGAVYKARDAKLGRFVAIKVLSASLESDPVCVERFHREARSIAALRHPNLMHIYSVGEENGLHYFVMEYIEGQTLAKLLAAKKQFALAEAVRIAGQVLAALHRVHGAGIVHRDLKPGNIMIDSDGMAILLDFGLAKDATACDLTAPGTIMGTPDYMAPEQIEGNAVGPYTDIYALGIILYEMLTHVQPFHRRSTVQTLRAHCEEPPPPLAKYRPDMPPEMGRILSKAMARQPSNRYQSAADMAAALISVSSQPEMAELAALRPSAAATQVVAASSLALARQPAWRKTLAIVAVLGVALLLGLTFRHMRNQPPASAPLISEKIIYRPQGMEAEPKPILKPKVRLERKDGSYLDGTLIASQGDVLILEQYPLGNRTEVEAGEIRYLKFLNDWPEVRDRRGRQPAAER